MMKLLLTVLLLLTPVVALKGTEKCSVQVIEDINLESEGIDPHEADMMGTVGLNMGVSTNIDVYHCGPHVGSPQTLVIFASGAPIHLPGKPNEPSGRKALTLFATALASEGYIVAVADKPNPLMGISSFLSLDFLRVITYLNSSGRHSSDLMGVLDIGAVVIGGHGFGGAQTGLAMSKLCHATFCPPQPWNVSASFPPSAPPEEEGPPPPSYSFDEEDEEIFSIVQAGFWYGGTAFQSMPPQEPGGHLIFRRLPIMTGSSGLPMLMIYGSGEDNYLGNDTRGWISYEQWEPSNKAYLVLDGLDHNGMTDVPITFEENTIVSTLDADVRAQLVADSVAMWLQTVVSVDGDFVDSSSSDSSDDDAEVIEDYCEDIEDELGDSAVVECLPEDDDDKNVGLIVGLTVGIGGGIVVLAVLIVLARRQWARGSVSHHPAVKGEEEESVDKADKEEEPKKKDNEVDEEHGGLKEGAKENDGGWS